jgi:hypothetical protein
MEYFKFYNYASNLTGTHPAVMQGLTEKKKNVNHNRLSRNYLLFLDYGLMNKRKNVACIEQ